MPSLKALRAPSPRIRHRATGQLVTDTIPSGRSEHPRRRRPRQHHRRRARFSHADEPGTDPGPPGEPTLRTCRKRASPILAFPHKREKACRSE
jgi:hypothetical protein